MRKLPYTITLTRKDGSEPRDFTIRACTTDDLSALLAMQEAVAETIADKHTFAVTSSAEISESLFLDRCFCAVLDGEMVAATAMIINRPSPRNAGSHIGYTEEEQKTCVTMEVTFILPAARGYGLQQIFFDMREEVALELGATQALTTISPDNEFSLNNALAKGYTVVAERALYGGLPRCILRKELRPAAPGTAAATKEGTMEFRKVRKKSNEISREDCIALLKSEPRGVLAVMGLEGYPYGVPVDHWYNEADGKIYIHGGLIGHRVDAVKANPNVSYTVMDHGYIPEGGWARIMRSVICFGRVEIIKDLDRVADICRDLSLQFTPDKEYIEGEINKSVRGTLCMAITIDHMSGKQIEES